jgi:hypothetical protein
MLENLKYKLLSARDRFILSDKDWLPEFEEPMEKVAEKPVKLVKQDSETNPLAIKKESST